MSQISAGRVVALFLCPGHRLPMRPVPQAQAVSDLGFLGDAHARIRNRRQVLLMPQEVLADLALQPGDVRENITTSGIDLMALASGRRLRLGEAVLEVTIPCEPCERMDELRPGLQREMNGRRGILARVVASGVVRVGDSVVLLSSADLTAPVQSHAWETPV